MSVLMEMNLFLTSDKIMLHPSFAANELILIDRLTDESSVIPYDHRIIPVDADRSLIHGLIGVIHLIAGPYLIVITSVSQVGSIYGQAIYRIDASNLISYRKTTRHLTDEQMRFNETYVSMVRSVLNTESFYFCNSYDLTHTIQRLSNFAPEFSSMSLFDRADTRFVWNRSLLLEMNSKTEFKKYCLPILQGFVSVRNVTINGFSFQWILISRRNVKRAGCRLFMRGSDAQGDVANYVETEQVIEYRDQRVGNGRCSFVQIRGSIPLFWSQMPNLKYKPPPVPTPGHNQVEILRKHVDHVTATYGPVVMINLINHTGAEGRMEKEFSSAVTSLNHQMIRYEYFDFHHECRKMRWDRLSILMERLARDQQDYGYFHAADQSGSSSSSSSSGGYTSGSSNSNISILCQQEGVFRTNCIDSLDRTNVLQGLIAKRSLEQQLRRISILSPGESIKDHPDFDHVYRNVWADNADIISLQYSGTGALKTDFTRTGKRTPLGALKDGYYSLSRYYKNNLTDGFRQDAIDLFLGHYRVDPSEGKDKPCPLDLQKDWKYAALPLIFLGSIAMFFFSMFLPHEHSTETFIYLCFWFGMILISLLVILLYGSEFVDYPRLRDIRSRRMDGE